MVRWGALRRTRPTLSASSSLGRAAPAATASGNERQQPGPQCQHLGALELNLRPRGYDWRFLAEPGKTFTDWGSSPATTTTGAERLLRLAPIR